MTTVTTDPGRGSEAREAAIHTNRKAPAEPLAGRRTLVTGATGFIGARLCEYLRATGAEVHALTRREAPPEGDSMCWHRADLADPEAILELVREVAPHTVFHLAGLVSGDPARDLVQSTLKNNLLATVNLLSAAEDAGSRRIVVTSSVVEPRDGEPASSPYAASKHAATEYARMFHALYGTPVVCLRLAMVYGPGQADSRKLIPHVIGSLHRGEAPEVSNGKWEVDWIYLDDVVQALLRAAVADGVEGRTLDVGSGEVSSIRTVVERLAEIVDADVEPIFGAVEDRPLERSVSSDLESTRRVLGWSPAISLADGLRKTVKSYYPHLPALYVALYAAAPTLTP